MWHTIKIEVPIIGNTLYVRHYERLCEISATKEELKKAYRDGCEKANIPIRILSGCGFLVDNYYPKVKNGVIDKIVNCEPRFNYIRDLVRDDMSITFENYIKLWFAIAR